jgi:hypothetical protein
MTRFAAIQQACATHLLQAFTRSELHSFHQFRMREAAMAAHTTWVVLVLSLLFFTPQAVLHVVVLTGCSLLVFKVRQVPLYFEAKQEHHAFQKQIAKQVYFQMVTMKALLSSQTLIIKQVYLH